MADNTTYPDCLDSQLVCWNDDRLVRTFACREAVGDPCARMPFCEIPLRANPDIAGPGVITSFAVSACLTWLLMLLYFLLRPQKEERRINPLNEGWKRGVCLPFQRLVEKSTGRDPYIFSECCFSVILSLGDQQLATCLAILIAGLNMLGQGKISVYHLTIVANMAWFSSGTQLATLMVLSNWLLRTNRRRRRYMYLPLITMFRVILMVATCILLMVLVWLQGYRNWYEEITRPAHCIPRSPASWGGENDGWAIASLIMLTYSYISAIYVLIQSARRAPKSLPLIIEDWDTRMKRRMRHMRITLAIYQLARRSLLGVWYTVQAEPVQILCGLIWTCIGISFTVNTRQFGQAAMSDTQLKLESEVGFGQLVALILLMLPVITCFETYHALTLDEAADSDMDKIASTEPAQPRMSEDTISVGNMSTSLQPLVPSVEGKCLARVRGVKTWAPEPSRRGSKTEA